MFPADCRVKIETDDYSEGSLVRGGAPREPAAIRKNGDFSRLVGSADDGRRTWWRLSRIEPGVHRDA